MTRSTRARRAAKQAFVSTRRFVGRAPKWLRVAVLAVVGAFAVYLLAANVILRTHLLRGWVSTDVDKLRLEYRSAWSLFPGRVEVRELSLRYQDANVQMLVRLDRAAVKVDLLALTERRFHVTKAAVEGVSYRLRQKLERIDGQEERVRAFPPIEGYADPPVEHKVPEPPIPDDQYDLWSIELPDISASLSEVWTMEFRYVGAGTVRGGFFVKPQREACVLPSVVLMQGGMLSLGDRDLMRDSETRIEAQIARFDVRTPRAIDVLHYLSAEIHQRGELVLPSVAATYLPRDLNVDLTRGTGPASIDISLNRGVLQPSTRITFRTDDVIVKAPSISLQTDLALLAHVDGSAGKSAVIIETTIAHAIGSPLEVRGARAMVDLGNADLVAPFGIARASGAVVSAHSGDLHAWQPFMPEKTSLDGGGATFAAHADYRGGALEGRLDLALEKARMTIGTFGFTTSGKAWTSVASADLTKAVSFPNTGLDLRDLALRLQSGRTDGLWMRSRFDNAALTTAPPSFDTDIGVESGPGDRALELFTRLASIPDVAATAAAAPQLEASLHLRVRPGLIALTVTKAKDGALEGRGRIEKRAGSEVSGAFVMALGPLHAGLQLRGGSVSVVPLAGGTWLDAKLQNR